MSSNATPVGPRFRLGLTAFAVIFAAPLAAQDDTAATNAPAAEPTPAPTPQGPPAPPRVNLMVTVPRGEVNQAQLQECRDDADAGTISGEIVVCRETGNNGESPLTGDRSATQKRYAQETMLKGAPRAPEAFGIPDNGKGIGFGKPPPVAITVDFDALPTAPAGSDADRMARGLPALGEDRELTEEEERARREAAGIKTSAPPRPKKKGG
ncbi:hypothetical protein FHS52_000902 [Erythromicrobium ramosum]|uniref:DUF3617 family protein n=1 Tax=Erythrobacter ramosus TaxID=35811 RepID=A0ABR6HWB4_9SPHN|nr:hypothetical protein [Erythrobacter ramosus]MBB3774959.1 hypothetical protein [Erythrobacter ramosus]